jgi:hypothetical protein
MPRTVLFKEWDTRPTYALYAHDGTAAPFTEVFADSPQDATGSGAIPRNAWTHLAATYDGATVSLYVNGTLVSSVVQSGPVQVSTRGLRIGGNSVAGEWFRGAIDEVRVYDRALSADEIATDMTTPVSATVPAQAPIFLLGQRRVERDPDREPAGMAEAYPSTATGGTIRRVSVYVDPDSTATALAAGIYSDVNGSPGTLLTEGILDVPIAGVWNAVAVPPVAIAAGARYWIALLGPQGRLVLRDRCCSGTNGAAAAASAQTTLTALPHDWTTGSTSTDGPASAYASG